MRQNSPSHPAVRRAALLLAAALLAGCPKKPAAGGPDAGTACSMLPGRATPLRLLTRAEYDNTVRDVLGDATGPADVLPREPLAFGFDDNADVLQATPEAVQGYLEISEAVSAAAVKDRKSLLVQCATQDLACGQLFVTTVGRRLYRHTLSAAERDTLDALFTSAFNQFGFDAALEWTLGAMLQSPQFLYRAELGDGSQAASVPLTGVELASKLSYFLWASAPDDALLDAAERGELVTTPGLRAQTARLLADARATDGTSRFLFELFDTASVGRLEKDLGTYPAFTPQLAAAWQTSLELYLRDVAANDGTVRGLLTSSRLYVNGDMSMYAAPPSPTGFAPVTMLASQRPGVLTQPGFLAKLAGPNQSSPIRRGVFVYTQLMCQPPQPPPANAAVTPPPLDPTATTRERFSQHSTDPACRGCHSVIDPMGFGFEHYDGMGLWRDTEAGKPVDASGAIVAATDESLKGFFTGAQELAGKLAQSRQVTDCLASQMFRYALGRVEQQEDACSLDGVRATFFAGGGRFTDLEAAIVESASFRTRTPPQVTP